MYGAFHVATVVSHDKHKVTIWFPDGLAELRDSLDFRLPSQVDLDWGSSGHIAPSPSSTPDLTASAPPLPYGAMVESRAPEGYWLIVPRDVPPPLVDELSHWGCKEAAEAASSPEPPSMWVYRDGSMSAPDRKLAHLIEPVADPVPGDHYDLEPGEAHGQDHSLDPILFPRPPPHAPSRRDPTIRPITGSARCSQATRALLP